MSVNVWTVCSACNLERDCWVLVGDTGPRCSSCREAGRTGTYRTNAWREYGFMFVVVGGLSLVLLVAAAILAWKAVLA